MKLINLEFKKYRLHKQGLVILAINFITLFFITMTTRDLVNDGKNAKDIFNTDMMQLKNFVSLIFFLYACALISMLIVKEYEKKTYIMLFSYPVKREKIILSKMCVIVGIFLIGISLSYCLCTGYILFVDKNYFNINDFFTHVEWMNYFKEVALMCLEFVILLCIPFIVAIYRKDMYSSIVCGLLIILIQNDIFKFIQKNVKVVLACSFIVLISLSYVIAKKFVNKVG